MDEVNQSSVRAWVQSALDRAHLDIERTAGGSIARARARNLVKALAETMRESLSTDECVFDRTCDGSRHTFGLNELLFDITVARVGRVASATGRKELAYVKEAIWAVESELHSSSREVMRDFSKLVLGSAHYKLFVGASSENLADFANRALREVARHCSGRVFVALVTSPYAWDAAPPTVAYCEEFRGALPPGHNVHCISSRDAPG